MNVLICYVTYSRNTEEIAHIIKKELESFSINVSVHEIGYDTFPNIYDYDALFIGTFTWDEGDLPEEMEEFIEDIGEIDKPVFVFGSGETQFGGDDLFCKAADLVADKYNSPMRTLKIEQSPRGSQESKVKEWTKEVAFNWKLN